jgi:predicted amidophosphoribosyltransferase
VVEGAMFDMIFNKVCKRCGSSFETVSPRQVYCSHECRAGKEICIQCGNEFIRKSGTSGKFCSITCWYRYNDSQMPDKSFVLINAGLNPKQERR